MQAFDMPTIVVIPARYGSTRFPGKPLKDLAGKKILERVWEIASFICEKVPNCIATVATETPSLSCPSNQIVEFCTNKGIPVVTTSDKCRSGSDRVWEVVKDKTPKPEIIVNLQGDVPTCPPVFVIDLINALKEHKDASVASVYTQLSWDSLEAMRMAKKDSPFSGTTVVTSPTGRALWFSKNILPVIRNEEELRKKNLKSPVKRHIGLYAYRYEALEFFAGAEKGEYEKLEQLEQLRFLENGRHIQMLEGVYPLGYDRVTSGIDSQDDLKRVEQVISENGELLDYYRNTH